MRFKKDNEQKLEYRKHKKYHDFNLKAFITVLLKDAKEEMDEEAEGEEDDEDSDAGSNSSYKSGDSDKNKRQKTSEPPKPIFQDPLLSGNDPDMVGPSMVDYKPHPTHVIEEGDEDEYLDETMKMLKKQYEKEQEFKGEIEDTIAGLFGDSDTRKKKKKSNKAIYIGGVEQELTEEQEAERQKSHRKFMESYNEQHRAKSLLEEHQEKKRDKKGKRKDRDFRPFDREKDLKGIDSKKAFKAIYNNNDMNSKFNTSNAKFL